MLLCSFTIPVISNPANFMVMVACACFHEVTSNFRNSNKQWLYVRYCLIYFFSVRASEIHQKLIFANDGKCEKNKIFKYLLPMKCTAEEQFGSEHC